MHGYRARVLEELRARGARGVLLGELQRLGIRGIYAHTESLRHEGFGIEQKPDRGLDGRGDSRFTLTEDVGRDVPGEARAASEERPAQELLDSAAPARPETREKATH